jgi:hypothetical protein
MLHRFSFRAFRAFPVALVVVIGAMVLVACSSSSKSSTSITVSTTTPPTSESATPTTLEPEAGVGHTYFTYAPVQGDCVDLRSVASGKAVTTRALPTADASIKSDKDVIVKLPCDLPHQYEVVAAVPAGLPSPPPPAAEQVAAMGKKLCPAAYSMYLGTPYPKSSLEVGWILPTDDQRTRGNQTIGCLAFDPKGKLTGTVRGSQR